MKSVRSIQSSFRKKYLQREEKYCTIEKECLDIKSGVQAFRVYSLSLEFVVVID